MSNISLIRPHVAARLPAVREQIALGKSWRQIAEACGLTLGQVEGMCHRWLREEWRNRPNPRPGGPGCTGSRQKPLEGEPTPRERRPVPVPRPPATPPAWVLAPVPPARVCQWPTKKPWRRPYAFCGGQVEPGRPYCLDHCRVAYAGTTRRLQADAA